MGLYLGELTSRGGGGAYKQQFTMWSVEFGKLSFTITLLMNDFAPFSYHHSVMYSTQSFDTDNFDVTYPCSMPLKDLCK